MAEHMLILKLTSPEGEVKYVTGAFPSASGKTNLAMLIPTLPGWKVGDGRRRHRLDEVRRGRPPLRGQPGGRLLRRRAGTSEKTNPNAMETIEREHDLHQLRQDRRRRHLVGGDDRASPPTHLIDWQGNDWTPGLRAAGRPPERPLHHPRGPVPDDRPRVGGPRRRADRRFPLRRQPRDRGAAGPRGLRLGARRLPRRDDVGRRRPRLRPERSASSASTRWRCCLSAATTWPTTSRHWLETGRREGAKLPKIFHVNWFRKDDDGKFLWPGFGENSRVLEWVFRRCDGEARGRRDADRPAPGRGDDQHGGPRDRGRGAARSCSRSTPTWSPSSCPRWRSSSPGSATASRPR